jgi:hypothetical protein
MVLPDDMKISDPPKALREDGLMGYGARWDDAKNKYIAELRLLDNGKASESITVWLYKPQAQLPGWTKKTPGPKSVPKESTKP